MAGTDPAKSRKLRRRQRERKDEESAQIEESVTSAEERQHRRRADKAGYLERKLAERERSERDSG